MNSLPHPAQSRNVTNTAPLVLFCLAALAAATVAGAIVRLDIEGHLIAAAILAQ